MSAPAGARLATRGTQQVVGTRQGEPEGRARSSARGGPLAEGPRSRRLARSKRVGPPVRKRAQGPAPVLARGRETGPTTPRLEVKYPAREPVPPARENPSQGPAHQLRSSPTSAFFLHVARMLRDR